jgi:shikimate dehydrogenase
MARAHLAVLGSPIEHSKSPAIHSAAYEMLGLDWDYGKYRIEANELESFLKLRDSTWRGLSLTMPLKSEAFRLSHPSCPVAEATGIVNTLLHTDGGWEGYNTDAFGIIQAVREHGDQEYKQISVLGSGATAITAVYAAKQLSTTAEIALYSRREVSIEGISSKPLSDFYEKPATGLTISTLPGGVVHAPVEAEREAVIFDVAYNPWPSSLSRNWSEGNRISGLEMLLWQALVQIRIFTSGDGTVLLPNESEVFQAMRNAVKA